jgi:outer membrane protein OmpA-like peptidoglycan-associated protein
MRDTIGVALLAATLGSASACSYDPQVVDDTDVVLYEYKAVREMEPQGPAFNRGLRAGYLDYSDLLYDDYDMVDFGHFAFKAVDSAKGENVLPDRVESRTLVVNDVDELAAARARLMAALAQTGRKKAAASAAKAQTSFDCWLEMTEDEDPPEEIERCKGAFEEAIAEVEQALTRDIVPAAGEEAYLVFFAWDQATLTPVALTVLDQVEADYLVGRPVRIVIAGHADRSGPEAYNQGLSEHRARNVAQALGQRGIPTATLQVEAYGESQPRVPTADGVREPQNRRVEVILGLERPGPQAGVSG